MSKKTKIWIIVALCFVFVGTILFVIGMSKNNWNFRKIGAQNFEINSYELVDNFDSIIINTDTANINFQYSADDKCRVVCYENKKEKHYTTIENGILSIKLVNEKKWYDYINLISNTPKINIYLPNGEGVKLTIKLSTGDVEIATNFTFESISILGSTSDVKSLASSVKQTKIQVTTGDISLENTKAESYDLVTSTGKIKLNNVNCFGQINLKVSTGRNYLTNVSCENIVSSGSTGDIKLTNVIVSKKIYITRKTGDVELDRCDASELKITTSTGDVEGTLLSNKVFIVKTDTGEIDVPRTTTGGKCEIATDTGDIEIIVINR